MDIYRSKRQNKWKKILLVIAAMGMIATIGILLRSFTSRTELEKALAEYEDGDFVDSLKILNSLKNKLDFDQAEIVYYYRCKAINKLAERLERKFDDELAAIASPTERKEKKDREYKYVEARLEKINDELGSDLRILVINNVGRIVSGGRFYDEFISLYKGSKYVEDLDYEELENIQKKDPFRLLDAVFAFYEKYPQTNYLSHIVGIFFSNIDKVSPSISSKREVLKRMLISYLQRYPTSIHGHKVFVCAGENVNLRNSPGVEGKIVAKLSKDEMLIQIEKSTDVAQIGETRDWWYRVSNTSGQQGWIFGKFLSPLDVSKISTTDKNMVWNFEDHFQEWIDSHTPKNWKHVEGADVAAISFYEVGAKKIAKLSSKGNSCGLYRRTHIGRAFTIAARGRHVAGGEATLIACAIASGEYIRVVLTHEGIDVLGRKIPITTNLWHEYIIETEDGRFAQLSIDGELVLNKIPLQRGKAFPHVGLYCLVGISGTNSSLELEYVKFR
ncbi:MAG: SH3 domain-containing protein [Spirochaetes bacterium]|nr:SH3 domain-containing protein [Spirochaetota bacterium]